MSRNVRNVQYLPRYGWTPVVLAPRDAGDLVDRAALALVPPGSEVLRARSPGPAQVRPAVCLARRIARVVAADPASRLPPGTGTTSGPSGNADRPAAPAASRLWRLQRLVFFPDDEIGWLPFAVVSAIRAHRARRFDALYSTSSPVTAHLVAGVVKRLTGVPWVAEFRDPLVGNPLADRLPWLHRRLQARLERWIVHSADGLVFVSPSTTRLYRRRYPRAAPMHTITNGHDRSESVQPRPPTSASRRFRIVWTGTLYRPAELEQLLAALAALIARRPELAEQLEVRFYGHVSDGCRQVADRFVAEGALAGVLQFPGFVPRHAALEALADADAALVMLGAGPGMENFVPGKLFDYLGQSKQVLAILPPGDARDILAELDWGVIADPDAAAIGDAIERLLAMPPVDRVADPAGAYDRVVLAGRLADTLAQAMRADARAGATEEAA